MATKTTKDAIENAENAIVAGNMTLQFEAPQELPVHELRGRGAPTNPLVEAFAKMPAPTVKDGKTLYKPLFYPLTLPDGIKPEEAQKVMKELARKTSSKLSSVTRRVSKLHPEAGFTIRMATDAAGNVTGLRIFRVDPATLPKRERKVKGAAPTANTAAAG